MSVSQTDIRFFVSRNGEKFGPLSLFELAGRLLTTDMLVWREGFSDWIPITDVPELEAYVRHKVPRPILDPPWRMMRKLSSAGLPPEPPPLEGTLKYPQPTKRIALSTETLGMGSAVVLSTWIACATAATWAFQSADAPALPAVFSWLLTAGFIGTATSLGVGVGKFAAKRRRPWARMIGVWSAGLGLIALFVTTIGLLIVGWNMFVTGHSSTDESTSRAVWQPAIYWTTVLVSTLTLGFHGMAHRLFQRLPIGVPKNSR